MGKRSREDMRKNSDVDNGNDDISSNVLAVTKTDSNSDVGRPAIDLTATDVISVSNESRNTNDNENNKSAMLFDLTDNVDGTNKDNTCILIESSDEEDDKPHNSIEKDKMKQCNTKVAL